MFNNTLACQDETALQNLINNLLQRNWKQYTLTNICFLILFHQKHILSVIVACNKTLIRCYYLEPGREKNRNYILTIIVFFLILSVDCLMFDKFNIKQALYK
jgi:hypothetical protein